MAYRDEPSANLQKVVSTSVDPGAEESGKFAGFRMVGAKGPGDANWQLQGARHDLLPGDHLRQICRKVSRVRHQKGNLANWHDFGVVSSQPRSDGVPERCKFASLRLLPEIRPWADFLRQRFREGMVSAVVGCQWRSWLHPTCKFAHRRSLPARAPGWVRKIAHPCADGQLINPPIGGFVVMVSSGRSPIRKGANLRNYSARGLTRTSAGAEVRGLCLWV